MHYTRRAFAALGTAALAAACSPAPSTPGTAGSAQGSTPARASGEITIWGWNPDAVLAPEWIDLFHKDHPDIKATYRFIQYSDYVNALRLGLTSDAGPDVFGLQVGALANQFAPLSADLTSTLNASLPGWKDKFLAADQLNIGGKQIGLPWMVTAAGTMEVNKTLLDSVGAKIPTNLNEWTDVAAKLTAAGKKVLMQGAKDAWQNIDVFQSLANQASLGHFYDAMNKKKKFESPEMIKAFEAWKTLIDRKIIQAGAFAQTAYPDAADAFRKGEAGMIAFGTWQNSDMTKTRLATYTKTYGMDLNKTEFQIVPFPNVVDPGGQAKLTLAGGPDVGWATSAKSKNPAAAAAFVQWIASSEASQGRIAKSMQQPAFKSVQIDTSDVLTPAQKDLVLAQGPALASMAGPRQIANADVQTALGDALAAVGTGQKTPQAAAADVQKAIDAAR
jgi:raffinose/stachyose/melibiose transport system substrate-binding protein